MTVLLASLAIAALSTFGDFVWATWIPQHLVIMGLVHGTLLFCGIGLALGTVAGRPAVGALGGTVIGAAAAGAYYLLAQVIGYSAMFFVWFAVWISLAILVARMMRVSRPLVRGLLAGFASGAAFYAISGIWMPFDPSGWDYAVHFAAWTIAYVPGFAAILLGSKGARVATVR